jgi:hypothetical protein
MVSPKALWPSLLLASTVNAAKWTITSVYVQTVSLYTYTNFYIESTQTYTSTYTRNNIVTVKPSVTITATPISAYTTTSRSSYYDDGQYVYGDESEDVVYIRRFYSPGAIAASDLTSSTYDYYSSKKDYTSTYYYQTVEYTAPTSCPTPFTVTTTTAVSIPSQVTDQVSIKSAKTSISTYMYDDEADAHTYTYVTAYLASTSHPSGAAASNNYIYRYYITDCINPSPSSTSSSARPTSTGSLTGNGGSSGSDDSDNQFLNGTTSCAWSNCGSYPYWGIIIVTVLPAIFLFGFLESYYWFTCLMSGKGALRVGTGSWILLCLPFIFLTRRIPGRDTPDQERLSAEWKEKSLGQRFALWRSWGLRYRYPVELLGVHPNYLYGNPAEEEKLTAEWYGENGDRPQVPASYMYGNAPPQMAAVPREDYSEAPQLPPRARLAARNSRSISSESHLASVPEESGSSAAQGKGKQVQKGPETAVETADPQVGRAPRIEDEAEEQGSGAVMKDGQHKDKDNSAPN